MSLPPLPKSFKDVQARLSGIFPSGTPARTYCVREMAAKTIFAMLYVRAVAGTGRWLAPKQGYRMGDLQAARRRDAEREAYAIDSMKPGFVADRDRWYADNSREPIRDETLKDGLVANGAVLTRPGLPTTSGKGRYALTADFAALFAVPDQGFDKAAEHWRGTNLSPAALARVRIGRHGAAAAADKVIVMLPSGESRSMEAGPSSVITKAVIEEFAPRFLADPAVISISESAGKLLHRDDALARSIGLRIAADKTLPDIILFDLSRERPLLVFVEAVATDGPITETRRAALLERATSAGLPPSMIAFVTAFVDRAHPAARKAFPALAWGSFAWFVSEPERLIFLAGDGARPARRLSDHIDP